MAFCGLINSTSRNHLHSGICRHFGKRSVAIWRNFFRATWSSLFDSTNSCLLSASFTINCKNFSTWNRHSLSCPCLASRERPFNVDKLGLHCSRNLLQEEALMQPSMKENKHIAALQEDTTDKSSICEDVSKHCQNSEAETTIDTATESTLTDESITQCTVGDDSSTLKGTETLFTEKEDSSSQASVNLNEGW